MRLFAFLHKHWRIPVALHVANACRDMARLQPGPEQPFPTVWDDAGREVLDHAPPFLALADSTFQGLLRIQRFSILGCCLRLCSGLPGIFPGQGSTPAPFHTTGAVNGSMHGFAA